MEKSAKRIDSLRSKMDALASVKTPTQEYKEVTKQIADAEKKLATLNDRMGKFVELGGKTNSKQYKSMQYDMAELENTIEYAKGELQDLVETGKAFTLGDAISEYTDLEKQFAEEQAKLNQLSEQYAEAQINLKHSMNMDTVTKGFGKVSSAAKKAFSVIQKSISVTWKGLKNLGSSLIKLTKLSAKTVATLSGIGPLFNVIRGNSKSSGQAISGFGRRILELAKSAFIFNLLSAGFRELTSGIGDAFQVYLGYDTSLKNSINGLRAQLSALQGSLSSAFAPIISVVIPYLSTLISWVTTAANAVAAFIATLTGKSSYKKAVANVSAVGAAADSTAGSLGDAAAAAEELEKALGHYDELNVINQNDSAGGSGGSGGGGGAASAGDITYEDVEISAAISDFAEKVKEAWQKSDFTEVGVIIGGKLESALDAIPWDGIQAKAKKIGKSLATLINGFVETAGLGDMIGLTVAEAINTGILGVEQFTGNLHFESIGQFIADEIVSALDNLEWESLTSIANNIGQGLANALNKVITPETLGSVGNSIANALNAVISGAYSFLSTADFTLYADGIANGINKFIGKADWNTVGRTIGKGLQKALDFVVSLISGLSWENIKNALQELWKGIAEEVDMGQVGLVLVDALGLWLVGNLVTAIGKTVLSKIGTSVVSALVTAVTGGVTAAGFAPIAVAIGAALAAIFVIPKVVEWLKDVDWTGIGNKISDLFSAGIGKLKSAVEVGVSLAKQGWSTVSGWLKNLGSAAQGSISAAVSLAKSGWSTVSNWLNSLGSAVKSTISAGVSLVRSGWATVSGWAKGLGQTVWNTLEAGVDLVKQGWSSLQDWFDGVTDTVVEIGVSIIDEAKDWWASVVEFWTGETKNKSLEAYVEVNPGSIAEDGETPEIEVSITGDNDPLKESIDEAVSYANETLPNETSVEITASSINIPDTLKKISGISVFAEKVLPGTGVMMTGVSALVSSVAKATGINSLEGIAASVQELVKDKASLIIQGITGNVSEIEKQANKTLTLKDVMAYAKSAGWMSNANKRMQIKAIAKKVGWDTNPNKKVTVSAFTKYVKWAAGADKTKKVTTYTSLIKWAAGADKTKTVTAKTNGISWLNGASKILSVSAYTSGINWLYGASKILTGITGHVSSVQKQTGASLILRGITGAISAIFGKAAGGIYQNGVWSTIPQKANGGIFSMNTWKSIPKYATGGTPHGTMFVAGEAGPEIVGHVGGRTEVLNKSQIASAIYSAVMAAMNESINNLAKAVLQHMTECTNTVIANMGYIVNSIQSAANASLPPVQFAGMPVGYIPDTNRTNAAYQSSYTGGTTIDYDKLAGAVANRISGNIQLENIMYMDKDIVYRKMVEVDRSVIKQTGHSGFGK